MGVLSFLYSILRRALYHFVFLCRILFSSQALVISEPWVNKCCLMVFLALRVVLIILSPNMFEGTFRLRGASSTVLLSFSIINPVCALFTSQSMIVELFWFVFSVVVATGYRSVQYLVFVRLYTSYRNVLWYDTTNQYSNQYITKTRPATGRRS